MARHRRTWIELSASNLEHNFSALRRLSRSAAMIAVVKANAYGHGLKEVITLLQRLHPWALGVAYGDEALLLRQLGYRGRIIVLSYWTPSQLRELVQVGVELVVWDWSSWRAVQALATRRTVRIHLKLDSGTSRIGFLPSDMSRLQSGFRTSRATLVGIFSHLANSEEKSSKRTIHQINHFTTLQSQLPLVKRVVRHLASTAAVIRYPEAHFGAVRPGIGLYGLWPSYEIRDWAKANRRQLSLRPVMNWYSRLAQVKTVPSGTSIGYGSTVTTKKKTTIGVIPVGYADGYDRRLSNRSWVMIGSDRARVLGRIAMNMMMVDLTLANTAKAGDQVTLVGPGVTVADLEHLGVFGYEWVARIHPQILREVVR